MFAGTYTQFTDDELAALAAKLPIPIADPSAHFRGGAKVFVRRTSGALIFGDGGTWITRDELAALEANGMQWPPAPTVTAAKKTAPKPIPIKPAPRPAPKPRPLPAAAKAKAPKITPKVEPMSTQKAIAQLGKIAADPRNPDRGRAARALERMANPNRVQGVTYLSPHAEEMDRKMGLVQTGGIRVEGSRLVLSAVGRRAK